MKAIRKSSLLVGALLAVGCAQKQVLLSGAEQIRLVKGDAPHDAIYVSEVSGQHGAGCGIWGYKGTYAGAAIDIRNKALAMGADYVQVMDQDRPNLEYQCYDNIYRIDGTAYRIRQAQDRKAISVVPASVQPLTQGQTQTVQPAVPLGASREQQLNELTNTTGISYEEYQRRYRLIMSK